VPLRRSRAAPILSIRSPHQTIEVRRTGRHLALFLGGRLRFHSFDAHRYCEALGAVPFLFAPEGAIRDVLVLGGGEGLLAALLLRFPEVRRVVVCERDPYLAEAAIRPPLSEWNEGAFGSPRVRVILGDPELFLEGRGALDSARDFDLILCDAPPPREPGIARLYGGPFYRAARARLREGGALATFVPFLPSTFATVHHALRAEFPFVYPYRAPILTMGAAGFELATGAVLRRARPVPGWAAYLTEALVPALFALAKDEIHHLAHSGCASALDAWRADLGIAPPGEAAPGADDEDAP
jgi:spermidine synthase